METKKEATFWVEFISGWISGIGQITVGQPFDIIKVRLQTQDTLRPKYSGLRDCFFQILEKEGPFAFYKGSLSPLIGVGTIGAIQFSAYKKTRNFLNQYFDKQNSLTSVAIAGSVSGLASSFICSPVEHTRIRMQI